MKKDNNRNIAEVGNFTKNVVDYFKGNIKNQTNYMDTFNNILASKRNNKENK